VEATFGPLEKKRTSIEMKFFQKNSRERPFVTTKGMKKFWKSWKQS